MRLLRFAWRGYAALSIGAITAALAINLVTVAAALRQRPRRSNIDR